MSSFAINGRILFDTEDGPVALAQAIPCDPNDGAHEVRVRAMAPGGDPRLHALDLVAALAIELRARGDHVTALEVE